MKQKQLRQERRKMRVRAKIFGTAVRPRMCVTRSSKHLSVQLIDDTIGKTLASVTSKGMNLSEPKTEQAKKLGTMISEKAKALKITAVVFDRSGRKYHGRIKALADAARASGLVF